jgi:hypothetical protein
MVPTAPSTPEQLCDLASSIFARILNTVYDSAQRSSLSRAARSRNFESLWDELQSWSAARPLEMRPLLELADTHKNPFPVILFSNASAGKLLPESE